MRRGRWRRRRGIAALLAGAAGLMCFAGLAPFPARGGEAPRRIVSLNLCTDQILLDLVPRERIAGLSHLVADPLLSGRVEAARGLPLLRGHAEEVLALSPDIVIAGTYSTPATIDLLQRLAVPVLRVPLAADFDGIRAVVRVIAEAVGEVEKGEAMIARFDQRLAAALPSGSGPGQSKPEAIVYHVNSLASGAGSLLDEIVRAAGFSNAVRDMGLGPAGRLPLETLLLDAPDVVVMATAAEAYRTTVADNLRHPAYRALLRARPTVHLPMPLWMCGTPDVAQAVEQLVAARARLAAGLTSQ